MFRGLNMFSPRNSWNTAHVALNHNHLFIDSFQTTLQESIYTANFQAAFAESKKAPCAWMILTGLNWSNCK